MRTLQTYILEEIDQQLAKRIERERLVDKKRSLLAIKKGLSRKDDESLKNMCDTVYASLDNFKTDEELDKAVKANNVPGLKEITDEIKKANGGTVPDINTILDVIEQISVKNLNLQQAIANIAKKL